MKKIVINNCFGGFGLSDEAYEKLIEWGVPVKKYKEQKIDSVTGLYKKEPENEGEVIFDKTLSKDNLSLSFGGRYWDTWLREKRDNPLLIRVVEELGKKASGRSSNLKIVKIPDDVDWEISEYDGLEKVEEKHRSWS